MVSKLSGQKFQAQTEQTLIKLLLLTFAIFQEIPDTVSLFWKIIRFDDFNSLTTTKHTTKFPSENFQKRLFKLYHTEISKTRGQTV